MNTSYVSSRLERCERALAASRDGFWERNLRTDEAWYSPSFMQMFGFAPDSLSHARGQMRARVHPDDLAHFVSAYRTAIRLCGCFDYEVRLLDGAGHWRWVRGRGQVWSDAAGDPELLSGAVTDVHREKIALLALEEQSRRLEAQVHERTEHLADALTLAEDRRLDAERANAAKTQFLAHISHEIRTPLNGVLGLNELALRGATSDDQRRYLEQARASGQTLLQVISDVLDLSRIEAGRHDLRPKPFDLAHAMAGTLRTLMPLAGGRDLLLMFDFDGDAHWVDGDESALRQIVTNLLGNALKFTDSGQVALDVQAWKQGDGQVAITVQVSDTGPGIAPDRQAHVFEPFVQGDDGHAHAGAGLGLAIAQRLTCAMDGTLGLHCPAHGGCVFTLGLRLPLAAAPVTAAAASPATPAAGLAWLVYPQQGAGDWLARRLTRLGWQCEVVLGVPAALQRAQQPGLPQPDLVLLAEPSLLPGLDLAPLRSLLPAATMRLLIRPDWHDPALETQARALQVLPLVAPLTPAQLAQIGRSASGNAEPGLRRASPVLPVDVEVLLVEDNPVNQLVGQEFLKALGLRVRLATDGAEALVACTEHPPALVLMDLQMPGMDGLTATQHLHEMRRDGVWPGAPIVALTAHASPADQAACRAAGMSGMLTKPLSLDMLRQQLPRWLSA
jgi:signal transduction histidine kinase/CheY-like chemotaxis protein